MGSGSNPAADTLCQGSRAEQPFFFADRMLPDAVNTAPAAFVQFLLSAGPADLNGSLGGGTPKVSLKRNPNTTIHSFKILPPTAANPGSLRLKLGGSSSTCRAGSSGSILPLAGVGPDDPILIVARFDRRSEEATTAIWLNPALCAL